MGARLASKHVVLFGVGHTNAYVVRQWGMKPIPDADLTCLSDNSIAAYSGMLPAVLARQLPPEAMEIDLVKLCSMVGARLITNEVTGFDVERQLIHFSDRPSIPFDVLSVGIGSVPTVSGVQVEGSSLLKIKPMQTFLQRLNASVASAAERISQADIERPLRILIAGSGLAGIEIAFCLPNFLREHGSLPFALQVLTRSDDILQGVIPAMRKRVLDELQNRNVDVKMSRTIVGVSDDGVRLKNGSTLEADLVIWATGASPPTILSKLGLPLDDRGFLATHNTLRSTSQRPIFAVGDSGTIVDDKTSKAGVYAVRQGPILWANIKATLSGKQYTKYAPQRSFLKLINTGDGSAIGEWKGFSFAGTWAKALKDRIDGRFIKMYQASASMGRGEEQMQCKGCGCKLPADVLEHALGWTGTDQPIINSNQLDDAAVVQTSAGKIIASTDFFTSPFDDPWLTGRVIALHAASDLFAMGANVKAALANIVIPDGKPADQRRVLSEMLHGARLEFSTMGAEIVGGHTIVGPRSEIGFTVLGESPENGLLLRKGNLVAGDRLYLTKPLGVGALMAAHMRSQCRAQDYETLIKTMLQRQHRIAAVAVALGIRAGTDITGFGLAGHLIEMLKASQKSASIELNQLPLLPGARDAILSGIESTLAPDNRQVECHIAVSSSQQSTPEYRILFDPQTSGGLLLGVPSKLANEFEQKLIDADVGRAVIVGIVGDKTEAGPLLNVV